MMWIKVKDRLPDEDRAALVTDGRHVTLGDWTLKDGWVLSREDKAIGFTADSVTHWMPLPELPQQEP
jgi:hypothetical protein